MHGGGHAEVGLGVLAHLLKSMTVAVSALALVVVPVAAPAGLSLTLTRADYDACQARDEQGFKAAIEAITFRALQQGVSAVDYKAAVRDEWRRLGLDGIIDQRVDAAIAEVRDETSWGQLLQSLAYQEKAKELATTVAERVYRSDAMKIAIESLAVAIGKEVGRNIELATADAAEPAVQCVQAFLGPRYGSTIARVVSQDAGQGFAIDPSKASADISRGTVLLQGSEGIAGAVILLVRRQLSNMASRVGQRLVGAVLGRLVSVVAGGIGVVLLAKDLWELRSGVLPIIADEMKSNATKAKVQEELATTISEQLNEQLRDIASKTAERVTEIWQDFRRAHARVLDIAEKNPDFKAFIDKASPDQLPRLDEVVAIVVGGEGDAGVLKRLSDGSLHAAVNSLDPQGMEIARETKSIDAALRWTTLAGDRLGLVVSNEIYKRAKPEDFTKASLSRLLNLQDRLASVRLASVTREVRDVLFELEDGELKTLARSLTEGELDTLARYLTGLQRSASQRVLRAVAQSPTKMQVLASARVRDALIGSRDQDAAVGMMLRSSWSFDPTVVADDTQLVLDGRVSPILLWERHTPFVAAAAAATIAVLLLFTRLLFGRRRRVA